MRDAVFAISIESERIVTNTSRFDYFDYRELSGQMWHNDDIFNCTYMSTYTTLLLF